MLKRFYWHGSQFEFSSRRYWNHFFSYAVFLRVKSLDTQTVLPGGAGIMVQDHYWLAEQAREDFDTFDNWYRFFQVSCDSFADDHFVLSASRKDWFNQHHSHYGNKITAMRKLAEKSAGYIGEGSWENKVQLSHFSFKQLAAFDLNEARKSIRSRTER